MFSGVHKPGRLLTALMALCYAFLSIVLPAHHTAGDVDDAQALVCVSSQSTPAPPLQTRLTTHSRVASGRCLACEWQASNLSVALPLYRIPQPRILSASIPDAQMQSRCVTVVARSSRAPPAA